MSEECEARPIPAPALRLEVLETAGADGGIAMGMNSELVLVGGVFVDPDREAGAADLRMRGLCDTTE